MSRLFEPTVGFQTIGSGEMGIKSMKILELICLMLIAVPSHFTVHQPVAPGQVEITKRFVLGAGPEP